MSSGNLIQFESSRKTASAREALREAREVILEKAKEKADKRKEREGKEQKWMLKDLEDRIRDNRKHRKKKDKDKKKDKKAKKSKKAKKEKKIKKKKKEKSSSSSEDGDSDGSAEWVEKEVEEKSPPSSKKLERESWMQLGSTDVKSDSVSGDFSSFGMTKSELSEGRRETEKQRLRREEEERKAEVQKKRELNPDLRGDQKNLAGNSNAARKIGDGGAAWLRRAFKRAEEQAAAEGKPIEEVAAARWGSLENFKKMLAKAEGRSEREEVRVMI